MRYSQTLTTKKPRSSLSRSFSKRSKVDKTSVPTSNQWKSWKRMKFCGVVDSRNEKDRKRVIFNLGDDILVLNHDWQPDKRYNLCDSWVGKIVDIRGNSPRNTWVIVKWYYSGKDIAEHESGKSGILGVDTSCYGNFERSPSQDHQVISTLSINGKATVVKYDDSSPDQEPIPPESFYIRRAYNSVFGSVTPNLDSSITCVCDQPYNPNEPNPMHFCPRVGCRQWYHEDCLRKNDLSDKSPDERIQVFLDIPQAHVHRIPPELLRLSCKPIIRGSKHGVVGNVKTMCEARNWAQLYAGTPGSDSLPGLLLNENGITLDRWLDSLDGIEVEKLIYPDDESDSEGFFSPQTDNKEGSHSYICPSCEKPI